MRRGLIRHGKGFCPSFGEVVGNFISENEGVCRHPEERHPHVLLKGCECVVYFSYQRDVATGIPHLGRNINGVLVIHKEVGGRDGGTGRPCTKVE